ncbi:MAG: anaerobic ribonucleoside-triphosphate reductase activating protein [bacterium]
MIEIKGFIETSFLDWDDRISSVIFLPGCNFRCPYCHADTLVLHPEELDLVPLEIVKKSFQKHLNWIDGLVISGGEPTIYSELPQFIEDIKKNISKIKIKLDTNGSNPEMIKFLIKNKLVDYIAMDIKTLFKEENYKKIIGGVDFSLDKIMESVKILLQNKIDYEFRITVIPFFHSFDDIKEISKMAPKKFVLQQFNPLNAMGSEIRKIKPYSKEEMEALLKMCVPNVGKCKLRGI